MPAASRLRLRPLPEARTGWGPLLIPTLLALLCTYFGQLVFASVFVLLATVALVGLCLPRSPAAPPAQRRWTHICTFARAFERRHTDPLVIRAVYSATQAQFGSDEPERALRPEHVPDTDFGIVEEDYTELVEQAAWQSGRSLEGYRANPFYPSMHTLGGLVAFLCHQPRLPEQT